MNLSDLLIFRTVVEEGGIVRAARKLHRVQSSVTTRIRQLEAALGAELFVRERGRLAISQSGAAFLEYADRLLKLADEARHSLSRDVPAGVLKLGALESTSASRLPGVLSRFHKAYPGVGVELHTGTNDALTDAVRSRQLDAAFVVERPSAPQLASRPTFAERLVLISTCDHPRIGNARDATHDSLIAFPRGCAYRRALERWLGRDRAASTRTLELASYHAIVACVAAGTGIALLPESVLDTVSAVGIKRHPLPKLFERVQTHLIWRANEATPAVRALCAQLAERVPAGLR